MKGPKVKSGPTFGKIRSRNKNGQWRRKRSDAVSAELFGI